MSYASFTKIVPGLLKNIPQKLLQPTGIAVIASVGIHAVVGGVLLPRWSMSSEKKSQPVRNVPLLQLTPAEQSRLPQLPPSSLPSMANQLPPLSSLPYSGSSSRSSSLPALPSKDSSLFNLPPISPLPPLGKIPSLSQSPRQQINLNQLAIRNSPSRNDLSTLKRSTSPNSQLSKTASGQPITPSSSELPPPPISSWSVTSKELSELPRLNPAYPPAVALNPDGTVPQQQMYPSTMPERPLPPSTPRVLPIDSYPIPPALGTPTQTPQATALAPIPNQRDLADNYPINPMTGTSTQTPQAAALAPIPNQRNSTDIYPINPMTGTPTQTPQAAALAPIPNQRNLTNNSSSSDRNNIAFLNNLDAWRKHNQINDLKGLEIPGNYPEKVSSAGGATDGKVAIAVKVDKDGKIIPNTLELMGNFSNEEAFEKAAISAIERYSFRPTGQTVGYVITVPFKNDSSVLKSPTPLQPPVALPNSAGLLTLPKLSTPTNTPRSTITGTPAQNLMEKLRTNLTNTPPSSTTDKTPASTTNTSRSSTTDKTPASTTNTSRSNTNDKKPESTTNMSRSNTTDTSAQNLINKLRRSLSDTPPSRTTDTPRSNTTDTTPPNPTKE